MTIAPHFFLSVKKGEVGRPEDHYAGLKKEYISGKATCSDFCNGDDVEFL